MAEAGITLHFLVTLFAASIRMAVPLTLAGLGETFSERSGVLNIGLEGIMLSGAFFSFLAAYATQNILIGVIGGCLGGLLISLIHAYMSFKCYVNQTIVGIALNFFSLGLTSFLFLANFGRTTTVPQCPVVKPIKIPLLSDIPVIGDVLFNQDIFVYFTIFACIISYIILYKTVWGINIDSIGEHPKAADTVGLNVKRTRYITAIINGCLGGLGGAYLTIALLGFFMENITSGKGFIALVVVILGRRNPFGVLLAALLVGAAEALQYRLQTLGLGLPSQVFIMLPYVVTVIVLLFSIGKGKDPSALGVSYKRSAR
jgi:simple sugar transport system permease protein